ncbi:22205_t:CDS:10 [Racocetra persica]|uniref:22205_t:CDS:1 n=1 Tax=Racocetra persica TaxID=160502 RepID=A0ACA9LFF1_9GLOM|nr:22205_t:CDS:10 [Racocetra persica]
MENSDQEKVSDSATEFKVPAPVNTKTPESVPPVPYEKPDWSDISKIDYGFEVIKGGLSVEIIDLPSKEFLVLDSAHGTRVNKQQISSRNYIRLRVGDQIKFGESTRTYVLLGPEEPQTQQTIKPKPQSKPAPETTGVTWGFSEDAEDENELLVAVAKESWKRDENAYYYKDPKKALRNWLENRGYDMEFESEQEGPGHARIFTSRIQLPDVEDAYGPVYGIGTGSKKRDADRQAAIDACEKLDMLGLLRAGQDEAAARKKRLQHLLDVESDDEDSFYDRTGQKDRLKSKKSQPAQKVETYESLIKQREELLVSIEEIRNKIHQVAESGTSTTIALTDDDLDNYMDVIRNEIKDESTANLENTLQDLLKQEQRLARLIEITKPLDIMQYDNNSSVVPNLHAINEQELSDIKKNLETIPTEHIERSSLIESDIPEPEKSDKVTSLIVPKKREISQEDSTTNSEKEKKIKALMPMTPYEYEEQQKKAQELNELEIEDATIWEPPQGQTGKKKFLSLSIL